jgi:iron complex outermembrane recepter protein
MKRKIFTVALALMLMGRVALAQKQDSTDYNDLSLEELMNIQIVSASKKSESLFDASLSASVLTREEIKNAGSTSIMEALRLIPGVIVREQSNGNYDVHIRGLDNVPPNSLFLSSANTTTLVMINNRPVYNYLQGGTFWESLPIDLNDVDRIEVVRGPSSTLYGPNAVSGVIHFITRNIEKDGVSVNGSAQYGSLNTTIANTSIGYKFSEKFDMKVSGNYQGRDRSEERYYDLTTDQWVNSANEINTPNAGERYPHPQSAMKKYGVNTFLHYKANDNANFSLTSGLQDSEIQSLMFDNSVANLSTTSTNSKYADFQASTYGLTTQISYATAVQTPALGRAGSKYDYNVVDATMEYALDISGLSVKPNVTYRSATYDDRSYWDNGVGTLNGQLIMKTIGGGVRLEYSLLDEKLRLTGGIRMDKFTDPSGKWFTSYQSAATYKITDKNLVRLVYSKAYRSPFIFDTYLQYSAQTPVAPGIFSHVSVVGNKNLNLLSSNMLELGYRSMLKNNVSLDIEGYYTRTENYTALIQGATNLTPANYPVVAEVRLSMENIPLQVEQLGTTVSMTVVVDKFQIKPFVTFQKTTLKDYSQYFGTSDASPAKKNNFDPANNNVNSGIGTETDHKFTPKAYGGAHINYGMSSKFNFNVSAYWFGKQTFYYQDNTEFNDGIHGVGNIEGKAIVNAKASYTPVNGLSIFVNGKNLLGKKSVEYYLGDATPMMVLGGVSFDF